MIIYYIKMKTKSLLPILFAFLILVNCSSEEEIEPTNNSDVLYLSSENLNQSGQTESFGCICDINYTYPTQTNSSLWREIRVIWDNSLTEGEKHCIRYQYFECDWKNKSYMNVIQSPDPGDDHWLVWLGKPGNDILNDICNDPMTSSPECQD